MGDINDRIAALSPAQRALLELRLKKRDIVAAPTQVIARQATRTLAPLSFAQQRLWFLDQLEPHNPAYNRPAFLHLTGSLNIAALEQSLSEIVHRHEVLRTTFSAVEGQPIQFITLSPIVTLLAVDLSHLPDLERNDQVERLAAQEAQRPFDLAHGPLLRASLLRLARQEHILLLTIHHIAFDGWSMTLLSEELAILYGAFSAGGPSPLPELPIQYTDFAVWQRQQLQGETLDHLLLYWRRQLSGAPAILGLPTDRPRPAVQTFRGARQSRLLPRSLSESLKTLSRQEGVTLFMTLLAMYKVLLHRYTGQTDIIVGSPIAGRTRLEMERLIGLFVNMLVLRTDLSGNPSFRELLKRVRKVTLGAYANQDLPFDKLVEELKPQRDLSRTPLFQVMFQLRNVPKKAAESSGLSIEECVFNNGVARLDLSLEIEEKADGLFCVFDYNTDLFDVATITRMVGHWQVLLESLVANPAQCLSDLPLLTEAERQQLLVEWNDTATDYPRDKCLHQLFEAQVEQTPGAVAVVFEDAQLTYRELNHRANQLAHHLRSLGVGPEVPVGLCVERSVEMVIGLLGILKAGGAYVPLDPAYPRERLAFMLEDAQVPVLLTQERLVGDFLTCESQIVCLDADWEVVAQWDEEDLTSGVTANNLAYVIYTSGSTGAPKGAMNTHRGICNRLLWMQDTYQLTQVDRILQKTPFSFDVSVWEFFWPLLVGARLIMARPGGHQDNAYLVKLIAERQITTLHFVPSMLQVFLEERGLETCNCLRRVICGGEALSLELQARFFARLDAELHNLYGPTEASIDVTSWACKRESNQRIVPIGRPIANTQIYLLDSHLQPVPVGVAGELHIGGVGLARGYLNRPELTAEKFIPNPFSTEPGARLYKTGDLACYRPDGNIEFLGRLDQQVKIRGFRIELGEIEAVLGQHPDVRATVVLAREDQPDDKRLVAYVVPHQGQTPTASALHHFLKEKLPNYMVPSAFVLIEVLPLTPSGKVDRRSLAVPDRMRPHLDAVLVPPHTLTEVVLARIWTQVLGIEPVGIHDNFFELGGDSILGFQIIARANKAGLRLTPRQLFQHQTIAELAVVAGTTPAIQAERGLVTGPVPLTPGVVAILSRRERVCRGE